MELQKYASLCIMALVTFTSSIVLIKFLLKKSQIALGKEINVSCAIWSICMLIGFNILNIKSISVASEAIDIIYKLKVSNILVEIFRIITIFIVINSICFLISYFSTNYLSTILLGKRKNIVELQNNNYSYFLIKGILFICLTSCLLASIERLLRIFLPILSTPFYH